MDIDPASIVLIITLVALSGIFSGLTLGLLSLNTDELERKSELGNSDAKKILPVRQKGNQLLCTLLLGNVAVNSAISIVLSSIGGGLVAGLTSTALIVVFGEIIPQATISRYALRVGAATIGLTKLFMFILWPITKPLSMLLDKFLGDELPTIWSKDELRKIIENHEDSDHSELDQDEERIILGALSYSSKTAVDVMTPRTVVYALEKSRVLNNSTLRQIRENRFSRIPVYDTKIDNIIGVLYTKDIIGIDEEDEIMVKNIYKTNHMIKVAEGEKLDLILNKFLKKRKQMAMVLDQFGGFDGIVTMEDVVEEILGREVYDEGEQQVDHREVALERGKIKLSS